MSTDATEQPEAPEPGWHAVLVPDVGSPVVESFDSAEHLAARLGYLARSGYSAFPVLGQMLSITKPPRRLLTPGGAYPLLVDVETDEVDPTGRLGLDQPDEDLPADEAQQPPQDLDDEFDDDEPDAELDRDV